MNIVRDREVVRRLLVAELPATIYRNISLNKGNISSHKGKKVSTEHSKELITKTKWRDRKQRRATTTRACLDTTSVIVVSNVSKYFTT